MELVRISAEQYSAMANFIVDAFEVDSCKTIYYEEDTFSLMFRGYAERGHCSFVPREIVDTEVSVETYNGDIEVANNFRADTLMAYVDEIVTANYNVALTDC